VRRCLRLAVLSAAMVFFGNVGMAQTAPSITGSKVSKAQASEVLAFHNKIRKGVGVPPLVWSVELAKYAQAWADHLAASSCTPEHRPFAGEWKQLYGESIFMANDSSYTAMDASKDWYSEAKDYKGGAFSRSSFLLSGHYTQMVWRATSKVGFGYATCKNGELLVVANYDPKGNLLGQTPY